jgi:hypothetical protein
MKAEKFKKKKDSQKIKQSLKVRSYKLSKMISKLLDKILIPKKRDKLKHWYEKLPRKPVKMRKTRSMIIFFTELMEKERILEIMSL